MREEHFGDCVLHLADCRDLLPDLPRTAAIISDLSAGVAGEHLVCADLLLQGYRAFLADQNCPFDVAVELNGRLIRIQVKATRAPKAVPQRKGHFPAYMWNVRRCGKHGQRTYQANDFDVLACVALDCRRIAYLPPSMRIQTVHIRTHSNSAPPAHGGKAGKTFEQYSFVAVIDELLGVTGERVIKPPPLRLRPRPRKETWTDMWSRPYVATPRRRQRPILSAADLARLSIAAE